MAKRGWCTPRQQELGLGRHRAGYAAGTWTSSIRNEIDWPPSAQRAIDLACEVPGIGLGEGPINGSALLIQRRNLGHDRVTLQYDLLENDAVFACVIHLGGGAIFLLSPFP